jgi:hypothetical protein
MESKRSRKQDSVPAMVLEVRLQPAALQSRKAALPKSAAMA